jgi:CHASE1-domain containing sensor protein
MKFFRKRLDMWSALPLTVLVAGLCISAAGALWLSRENDAQAHQEFEVHVQRMINDVTRRFRMPVYGLNGIRDMYAATKQMPRASFRGYVESRDLSSEFPGVRGFGFIEHVARDRFDAFVERERADDAPQFDIRSLGVDTYDDLYVIKFIEPI